MCAESKKTHSGQSHDRVPDHPSSAHHRPISFTEALAAGQSGQDHPVCRALRVTVAPNNFVAHVGRRGELEVPTA